ncbi:hypothetical protein [Streptomyces sp. NPDC047097]|uniref:hypothetical protein n=1 Tax=Streptomyces sp. NPDC047097 TaxID=3155260 RepID=UPI0033F04EE2
MNPISRSLGALVMAGSMVVAGIAVAGPAAAAPASAAACSLGADAPKAGAGGTIVGVGSRTGCGTSRVTLTVRVQKKRFLHGDVTVGSRTHAQFGNGNMSVVAGCDGNATYFTETLSSTGNKVKSAERKLC